MAPTPQNLILGRSGFGTTLLLQVLSRFMNFVISGKVFDDIRPFFFWASLVALSKSEGGVRPIAFGCTLRRLVGKCANQSIREAMGGFLSPLQLGCGTPLGAEVAVNAARTCLHKLHPESLMLKVDFCNAFNSIR
jgi:hypothetical protein